MATTFSNSPRIPKKTIQPSNFKSVIKTQSGVALEAKLDEVTRFSSGGIDGRFSNNQPNKLQEMSNPFGEEYHRVGLHLGGDLSVAAP